MHDGILTVYSDGEGHGCTFTLQLPLSAQSSTTNNNTSNNNNNIRSHAGSRPVSFVDSIDISEHINHNNSDSLKNTSIIGDTHTQCNIVHEGLLWDLSYNNHSILGIYIYIFEYIYMIIQY
jgi:hypothetical protein